MAEKQNLYDGNTVLAPEYSPSRESEFERLKKAKRESQQKTKQNRINKKARLIANTIIVFAIGLIIIYRYSLVFNLQKNLVDESNKVNKIVMSNENINVQLAKFGDIRHVQDVAINKLHMVRADKNFVVYVDLNKQNFPQNTTLGKDTKAVGIIDRIKKLLF